MDIALLVMGAMIIILLLVIIVKLSNKDRDRLDKDELVDDILDSIAANQQDLKKEMSLVVGDSIRTFSSVMKDSQMQNADSLVRQLEAMRKTIETQLFVIQKNNQEKLDSIQNTVNEKLESQLAQSFKLVSERLEKVYQSLGEMQSIATGVGDLKKVLLNVKNRGILGEIQLGSILQEILAPEQYETEIATVPASSNRVEFAVKLPGANEGERIYLPIDSKFPGDTYTNLLDAYDSGDKALIDAARKVLETTIRKCAKDIKEKYVSPPYTTNFGIMFLPFEGLYAEVVNLGMVERLQREYNVNIAGPSTMAAMLNSLQMGFKTLAIQKKSNEVWQVLGAVKTQFEKFNEVLERTQKHIRTVDSDLEELIGTRSRQINRKLSGVESIEEKKSLSILDSEDI